MLRRTGRVSGDMAHLRGFAHQVSGRRRALGWRFAVERISLSTPGGRGGEAVCPGEPLRVQVTVACGTELEEDGIHGALLLCDGPCSGAAVDRCRTRLGASPEDGLFLPRLTGCHPSTEPQRRGG